MLADDVSEMPKNWNRRFKHNRDKIKTGDIYELAEVVRNLAIREHEKGLSTGEKQMFTRAKKILASELMYALDKDEDEAEAAPRRPPADSADAKASRTPVTQTWRSRSSWPPGRGERLGSTGPRRSSRSPGRPMLEWSLEALRAVAVDRAIVVALPAGRRARARRHDRRARRRRALAVRARRAACGRRATR